MATPLDKYDLPDIDQELSDSEPFEVSEEARTYERNPLKETASSVQLSKTESLHELERRITNGHIPSHDVINPMGSEDNAVFPEEYQVETDTGLVKCSTALSLSRQADNQQQTRQSNPSGLTKEKLDKAVERNRKELEKHKNGKTGWLNKLKNIFT